MPVENLYDIGDQADLTYTLRDASGALVNGTVVAYSLSPAGASAGLAVTHSATGIYTTSVAFTEAGRWLARFTSTGANKDSETAAYVVRPNAPARPDAAYANVEDVVRLTQGRTYNASSIPNISEVHDFLALSAAQIDGILRGQGYALPVATGATSTLRLLAHGNALGARALVESAAPTAAPNAAEHAEKLWCDFKKALGDGDLELDAGRDTGQSRPRFGQATALLATSFEA